MEQYQPELVLVEGPENANDLISILARPETRAPVALYYAYRDDAGILRAAEPSGDELPPDSYACYLRRIIPVGRPLTHGRHSGWNSGNRIGMRKEMTRYDHPWRGAQPLASGAG